MFRHLLMSCSDSKTCFGGDWFSEFLLGRFSSNHRLLECLHDISMSHRDNNFGAVTVHCPSNLFIYSIASAPTACAIALYRLLSSNEAHAFMIIAFLAITFSSLLKLGESHVQTSHKFWSVQKISALMNLLSPLYLLVWSLTGCAVNEISILCSTVVQCLIVLFCLAISTGTVLWSSFVLLCLCSVDLNYFCLIPVVFSVYNSARSPPTQYALATTVSGGLLWLLILLAFEGIAFMSSIHVSTLLNWQTGLGNLTSVTAADWLQLQSSVAVRPGISVFWYLLEQVFSQHRSYFTTLLSLQVFLASVPIHIGLTASYPTQSAALIVAFNHYYNISTSVSDIYFIVCLLLVCFSCTKECNAKPDETNLKQAPQLWKYASLFISGICGTTLCSVATAWMWISAGTGNANFLFFQSLALYLLAGLALVECIRSLRLAF